MNNYQCQSITNISRSQVSEITKGLNGQVSEFRNRSLAEHRYPVIWVDALYEKVRFDGHVISMAVMVVSGVSEEGSREILAIEPMTEDWSTSQAYMSRQSIQSVLTKAA